MESKIAVIRVPNSKVGMQYANDIIEILKKELIDNTYDTEFMSTTISIVTRYCRVVFAQKDVLWQLVQPDFMLEVSVANPTVIKQCEETIVNYILQCEQEGKNAEWRNR